MGQRLVWVWDRGWSGYGTGYGTEVIETHTSSFERFLCISATMSATRDCVSAMMLLVGLGTMMWEMIAFTSPAGRVGEKNSQTQTLFRRGHLGSVFKFIHFAIAWFQCIQSVPNVKSPC